MPSNRNKRTNKIMSTHRFLRYIGAATLVAASLLTAAPTVAQFEDLRLPPVQVVDYVDIDRYVGLWYEVARFPNYFEIGCVCTTATYGIIDAGTISVLNTCNRFGPRRPASTISGEATVTDPDTRAKLSVAFAKVPFPGSYWIIDLVDDPKSPTGPYAFAVVSDPARRSLFILARGPRIDTEEKAAMYAGILGRLKDQYYDTGRIRVTRQPESCAYPAAPE
jgi:apolipoprotein D and lipocalin family protein